MSKGSFEIREAVYEPVERHLMGSMNYWRMDGTYKVRRTSPSYPLGGRSSGAIT
jgi:hypothetical protein